MTIETLTVAGAFDDENDLFTRPPRALARQQAKTARITCRVCDRPATVPLDHPALLCPECLSDLDATRRRVADWLESALRRLDENQAQWEADIAVNPASDRWPAIQAALIAVAEKRATQTALDQTWAKRKAEGGALSRLLKNYEIYAAACDQLAEELERLHKAQTELNAAWMNTPMEEEAEPRKGEYAIPTDATPTTCRSCGAGMVFIKTTAGKALPLSVATIVERDGVRFALAHFADCPNSKEWSKK